MRWNFAYLILVICLEARCAIAAFDQDTSWDYILYVQHWPITVCMQWMEKSANNNCTIPVNYQWTVHGSWPTKIGTDGPQYCNSTWNFNRTVIEPIESELEQYWTNIEANTELESFWEHEWKKHGTCAVNLKTLNNEFNYFNEAITWAKYYSIGDILAMHEIHPDGSAYSIQQIHDAIKSTLGVNPVIECVVHGKPKMSLLSEIRLCFNKSLSLIDCDIDKMHYLFLDEYLYDLEDGQILTDCSLKRPIMYFGEIPHFKRNIRDEELEEQQKYLSQMGQLYQFLQFLIWLTL
ncbi:Ribonuclease T2 family [Popillia japonica]|uniref:Ribonuclease T2 family n=1 Tax=Popillia japonica TaxID=7064 RepID=A0AAW1LUM5_POPJA